MKIKDHSEIIELWPSVDDLARELIEKFATVYSWKRKKRIPVEYWKKIIKLAKKRDVTLTADILLDTYQ